VEEQTDSTFIKNISIIMAILVVFTIAIALIARSIGFKDDSSNNPSKMAIAEERIKPVAGAYTGKDGPAPAAVETAAVKSVAFDGSLDSEMIYKTVCAACHTTAVLGAPKPGSPEMAQRAEKGMDVLLQNAINGINAMPARGGRSDLSDEQVKVVIDFMLE